MNKKTRQAVSLVTDYIAKLSGPRDMTPGEALEFFEEILDHVGASRDALKEEAARASR